MSQQNVDTLRAVYDEWFRSGWELRAGGELFDAHTVSSWDQGSEEPGRLRRGRRNARHWMRVQLAHLRGP